MASRGLKVIFSLIGIRSAERKLKSFGTKGRQVARGMRRAFSRVGSVLGGLVPKFRMAALGVVALGGFAIKAADEYDMLRLRLRAVTKNSKEARKAFEELYAASIPTPFTPQQFVEASILLRSFGLDSIEAVNNVASAALIMNRNIQDVAMAIGSIETEPFRRLGIEIERTKNKATIAFRDAMGRDIRMTTNSIQELRETLANVVFPAKFGGGLARGAFTPSGQVSIIKGKIQAALAEIGDQLKWTFMGIADAVGKRLDEWREKGTLNMIGGRMNEWFHNIAGALLAAGKKENWQALADVTRLGLIEGLAHGAKELFYSIQRGFIEGKWLLSDALDSFIRKFTNAFDQLFLSLLGPVLSKEQQLAGAMRIAGRNREFGEDAVKQNEQRKKIRSALDELDPKFTASEELAAALKTVRTAIKKGANTVQGIESDFKYALDQLRVALGEVAIAAAEETKESAKKVKEKTRRAFDRGIGIGDLDIWDGRKSRLYNVEETERRRLGRLTRDKKLRASLFAQADEMFNARKEAGERVGIGGKVGTFGRLGSFKTRQKQLESLAAQSLRSPADSEKRALNYAERTAKAAEKLAGQVSTPEKT